MDLKVTLVLSICLLLGIGLSFFHLGYPQHAVYATQNLGQSWLSREILIMLIFAFLTGMTLLILLVKGETVSMVRWLQWFSIVAGILLVYSMSLIYMIETVPAWNRPATPISFFNTSIMLGAVVLLLLLPSTNNAEFQGSYKIWIRILGLITTAGLVVALLLHLLGGFNVYNNLYWIRMIFILLGIATMLLLVLNDLTGKISTIRFMLIFGFIIICTAEFLGRVQFYQSYSRIGV
jgi:anaerobic dimethyl sulfoxide reductase subunit C (anchor subunit)